MKILSGVFTDSDSKLTVMYENEGTLESGIFRISRIEVEKYERVDFPIEIGRNKIAFTATKAERYLTLCVRQTLTTRNGKH
jgi:hypothetical protein